MSTATADTANLGDDAAALPTTVLGTLRYAQRLYDRDVTGLSPADARYQPNVSRAMTLYLRLWSHICNEGVFRRSESLREMTDTSLELITVPFMLGVLAEKRIVIGSQQQQQQQQQPATTAGGGAAATTAASPTSTGNDEIDRRVARSNARLLSLTACNDFLFKFLKVAVELELATEHEVATRPFLESLERSARMEMSRRRFALEDEYKQLDARVRFARERARRNARIMREDDAAVASAHNTQQQGQDGGDLDGEDDDDEDDASRQQRQEAGGGGGGPAQPPSQEELQSAEFVETLLEDDDDYQAAKRARHTKYAEWCIMEAYAMLQGNAREMEIVGSLSDAEKRRAIEDFQRGLTSSGPGLSTSAASAAFNAAASASQQQQRQPAPGEAGANYTVLPGGHVVPMGSMTLPGPDARQQIRDEAFINRNMPTQTLAEFADMEMAFVQEQQDLERRNNEERAAEDERLGEEGVEERERQRTAAFDDWKDSNPSVGITSKGNYA